MPLPEGNQIYNFISSSGSGTVINYGSGSHFLTSNGSGSTTVPVPVPQRCLTVGQRELEHGEKVAGGHEHHRLGADLQAARDLIVDLGLPVLRPHVEDHLTGTVYGSSLHATSQIEKTGILPLSYFFNLPEQCCGEVLQKVRYKKVRIPDEGETEI